MNVRVQWGKSMYLLALAISCGTPGGNEPRPAEQETDIRTLRACILRHLPPEVVEQRQVSGYELVIAYLGCRQGQSSPQDFRSIAQEMAQPDREDPSKLHLLPDAGH